jgi:hypothetical protein
MRTTFDSSRRALLRGAAASALAVPLAGLFGRRAMALSRLEPVASPYGPVAPVLDQTTGLPLLQLPEGFTYQSFGWSGDLMVDGRPNPTNHDGMSVVRSRLVNGAPEITLIRNHEASVNPLYGTIEAAGFYDRGMELVGQDSDDNEITGPAAGGTTTLVFTDGAFSSVAPSLGGTWVNCAGGLTPWGTWLSGEEDKSDFTESGGQPHGYMFEVSPDGVDLGPADQGDGPLRPRGGGYRPLHRRGLPDRGRPQPVGLLQVRSQRPFGAAGARSSRAGRLYMAKVAGDEKADLLDPSSATATGSSGSRSRTPTWPPSPSPRRRTMRTTPPRAPSCRGATWGRCASRGSRGSSTPTATGSSTSWTPRRAATWTRVGGLWRGGPGRRIGLVLRPATETLSCLFQSENPQRGRQLRQHHRVAPWRACCCARTAAGSRTPSAWASGSWG